MKSNDNNKTFGNPFNKNPGFFNNNPNIIKNNIVLINNSSGDQKDIKVVNSESNTATSNSNININNKDINNNKNQNPLKKHESVSQFYN